MEAIETAINRLGDFGIEYVFANGTVGQIRCGTETIEYEKPV